MSDTPVPRALLTGDVALAAEALMPNARCVERFSRKSRPGWDCWGDEVGKFDLVAA